MDLGLTGKTVLVSGASRGIGLSIARAFAREGARVAITGRDPQNLAAARAAIAKEHGEANVLAIAADMTSEADIRRAFETAVSAFSRLDVVVANVGSGVAAQGFSSGRDEWDKVLANNLLSGTMLASRALEAFVSQRRGNLIFISSIAGIEAIRAPVAYSAAKAALQMAMKLYAQQAGPSGVRVNAVAPGNVLFPGGRWEEKLAERREFFESYVRDEVALQRFGKPEEIADAVLFLASERASFVTGAVWVVDGGQTRSF